MKLYCNHYITSEMRVNINVEKCCNWFATADFSQGTLEPTQLAEKFVTVEIATAFRIKISEMYF